jgi:hypothetical protein
MLCLQAALMWGKKYCDSNPNTALKDVIGNFLEYIQFHKIPANVLMREVHPLGLVPYSIIMNALAYQVMPSIPVVSPWPDHVSWQCSYLPYPSLHGSTAVTPICFICLHVEIQLSVLLTWQLY